MNKLKAFLGSKKAARGWTSVLLTILFIAVIVGLNFAAKALQNATPAASLDVTSNDLFTLSDDSKAFLDTLEEDITITVLIGEDDLIANGVYYNHANSMVKQMAQYCKKIKLQYIDYNLDESIQENHPDVTLTNSSIFLIESSKSYRLLNVSDIFNTAVDYTTYTQYVDSAKVEQAIATSIMIVTSDNLATATIIDSVGDNDYSGITALLQENAYTIEYKTLSSMDISDESSLVILFAPTIDLSESDCAKIKAFLNSADDENEKSLIYIPYYEQQETPNIDALIAEYQIEIYPGIMYELDDNYIVNANNPYMNSVNFNDEIFCDNFDTSSVLIASPYTRPVIALSAAVEPLLYGTTQSGIYPFSADESEEEFDAEAALTGTPVIAAAVYTANNQNVFVFGSSDAFAASVLSETSFNNDEYFINICNTISSTDQVGITIDSKGVSSSTLDIKYDWMSTVLIIVFRWAIPLFMVICGIVVFIKKKKS